MFDLAVNSKHAVRRLDSFTGMMKLVVVVMVMIVVMMVVVLVMLAIMTITGGADLLGGKSQSTFLAQLLGNIGG